MQYKFAPAFFCDSLTPWYDFVCNLTGIGLNLQKKVLELIPLKNGQHILDIGAGTGTLAILLKETNPAIYVTGIDPDERILEIAQKKAAQKNVSVKFLPVPAEKVPFPNEKFHIVVSTLIFHHLPTESKKQALKEIYRVLKNDGKLFLVDIGKPQNIVWKIILTIESVFEPRAYLQDNLAGKIPEFMHDAGFSMQELREPYRGIRFWMGSKN